MARGAQRFDERTVLRIDVHLAHAIVAAYEHVHREGIEHLVREHDAADRRERVRH